MAKVYEYQGKMLTVAELVQIAPNGISKQALQYRLKHGVDLHTALTEPIKTRTEKKSLPCGAKNPLDCLNCTLPDMPCLKYFAPLKGESLTDYVFEDYGKR